MTSKRNELRAKLLGNAPKRKTEIVTLFGAEVELRQPTLATIMEMSDVEDSKQRSVDMFLKYAYVPGTNELVFEKADAAVILDWPFGNEILKMQEAIGRLTGLKIAVDDAEVAMTQDPLEEQSSSTA